MSFPHTGQNLSCDCPILFSNCSVYYCKYRFIHVLRYRRLICGSQPLPASIWVLGDRAQVYRLGGKRLHLLSALLAHVISHSVLPSHQECEWSKHELVLNSGSEGRTASLTGELRGRGAAAGPRSSPLPRSRLLSSTAGPTSAWLPAFDRGSF